MSQVAVARATTISKDRGSLQSAWAIARRSLLLIPRVPSTFLPSLAMPVIFTVALSGAFAGLVLIPGFPASKSIDWFAPMTTLQGAAFAGITTGMGVARDLENGFYDRLLASPVSRTALLFGPLLASVARGLIPLSFMIVVAFVGGAHFTGGITGVLILGLAALSFALIAGTWATMLALRMKTQQAAPLMQIGIFITFFLSTTQMPLNLISGWLHNVARFNPMTNVLTMARQGFLGHVTWAHTWPGLISLLGMELVLLLGAFRAMQKITP